MALTPPKRVQSDDRVLNAVQDGLTEFARGVVAFPLINGVRKTSVSLSAGADTRVAHGLERVPQGWFVTQIARDANVYCEGMDVRFITLRTSADCTVDLLIF